MLCEELLSELDRRGVGVQERKVVTARCTGEYSAGSQNRAGFDVRGEEESLVREARGESPGGEY